MAKNARPQDRSPRDRLDRRRSPLSPDERRRRRNKQARDRRARDPHWRKTNRATCKERYWNKGGRHRDAERREHRKTERIQPGQRRQTVSQTADRAAADYAAAGLHIAGRREMQRPTFIVETPHDRSIEVWGQEDEYHNS